jgi:hypothetical protein
MVKLKTKLFSLSILSLFIFCNDSQSTQIIVDSNSAGLGNNFICTLRSAITAAETDSTFRGCSAGSGADVIVLPANETFTLTTIDHNNVGGNALPGILSTITIEGNNSVITRSDSAPQMRFFKISQNFVTGATGNLTLKNMTISHGSINGSGGAIDNGGLLLLDHVKVINNRATFEGGAIICKNSNGICEIKHSSILNNVANYAGGIKVNFATMKINSSLIYGNSANIGSGGVDAGAFYVEDGNYSIINSTIAENTATRYGGLVVSNSTGFIDSSTIVANNPIGVTGTTSIKNSILSGNMGGNCRVFSTITSNGYNHSDDDSCSFSSVGDVTNSPINLMPLTDVDNYTATYPIFEGGPAIDTGDPNCPSVDQRGVMRPQDGDNNGQARCDKGSHEKIYRGIIFNNDFE